MSLMRLLIYNRLFLLEWNLISKIDSHYGKIKMAVVIS